MGEGSKGAVGVIRLGNWGGPLGAERGLWGFRFESISLEHVCEGNKRAVGVIRLGKQGGSLGAERELWGGWGLSVFLHRACVSAARGRVV